jgi:RNA polymerase sigma factor (sigma-70 family)
VRGAAFPETRWSQLLALHDPAHPARAQLLEGLARTYWRPAYHYLRALRRGSVEDAEDLTQQFFAMLLARGDLDHLSPERGSFRGFLKTALRNFVISAERSVKARERVFTFTPVDESWTAAAELTPEQIFDRAWGNAVLAEAVERLRAELEKKGKEVQFALFQAYCLTDEGITYQALAAQHGLKEDDVRNRLREARARVREILRRLLREYLGPDDDVELELGSIIGR